MKHSHSTIILCIVRLRRCARWPSRAVAASAAEIDRNAGTHPPETVRHQISKALGEKAKAVLVFPSITKWFRCGGLYGEALMKGENSSYYEMSRSRMACRPVPAIRLRVVLMTDAALNYLTPKRWLELYRPSIVVVDKGAAGGISTTTARSDVYAFVLARRGSWLVSSAGTKITRISK